jgi:hypothetical protein
MDDVMTCDRGTHKVCPMVVNIHRHCGCMRAALRRASQSAMIQTAKQEQLWKHSSSPRAGLRALNILCASQLVQVPGAMEA